MDGIFKQALREQGEKGKPLNVEEAVQAVLARDMAGEEGHRLLPIARAELSGWLASKQEERGR